MLRLLKITLTLCALGGIGALFTYGVSAKRTDQSLDSKLAAGKRPTLPALNLQPLVAEQGCSLTAYRGRVTVINFWASWCESCREELKLLAHLQHRLSRRGVAVVGVATKDVSEDAAALVAKMGLRYEQCHDGDSRGARAFGVTGLPETFIIDRMGKVAALKRGPITTEWLDMHITRLTKEKV